MDAGRNGKREMGNGTTPGKGRARSGFAFLVSLFPCLLPIGQAQADTATSIQAVHKDWMAPRAVELVVASEDLTQALEVYCGKQDAPSDLDQPRRAWRDALDRWERLSAVAIGPVLERRAQRRIDFSPTRPRMIEKGIRSAPKTPADMELIGTPAKGFPALEWLLWVKPAQPGSPACAYAVQVAAEIQREAQALAAARPAEAGQGAALAELLNQWVGGLERLRWADMEMPARVAMTGGKEAPDYPRRDSGASAMSWAARWASLRDLAVGPHSLEAALRQAGHAPVAEALAGAVGRANAAMAGLPAGDTPRILEAARELAALKRLVENEVATALGVSIGFSDADGD